MLQILAALISPITSIVSNWQKKKLLKQENEMAIAKASVDAKIRMLEKGQDADIRWENTALQQTGIKDEIMMFVVLTPMVMCFFPGGAELVRQGFVAMDESLPDYWQYAFYATIAVSYGLRKFTDFKSFMKG